MTRVRCLWEAAGGDKAARFLRLAKFGATGQVQYNTQVCVPRQGAAIFYS